MLKEDTGEELSWVSKLTSQTFIYKYWFYQD